MAGKKRKGASAPGKPSSGAARAASAASGAPAKRVGMSEQGGSPQRMDVWDRIAWTCLHIMVVLVPLAMSNLGPLNSGSVPFTFDQFDIVKVFFQRGLMLVALGAWAAGILLRGGKVRVTRVEWVALAFIAWVALTSVLSLHPPTAIFGKYRRFEGLVSFVTYAVTFFVALQYADRPSRIRSLARSLAIGGFLVAGYGAIQVIGTVGLGFARVLQPVSVIAAIAATIGLVALAFTRTGEDPEVRRALLIGAAISAVGGLWFTLGLANNIDAAVQTGAAVASIDPVRWGNLPFETNRAFSTFGNPDLLGGYLIFPWAVSIGLAFTEKHRLWRIIYWTFTVLNVFVGITCYVRGAWIGATAAAVIFAVAYLRARSGSDMRTTVIDRAFMGGAAALGAAAVIASTFQPDHVRNVVARVISIFQFDQGSALTRFQIWEAARAAIGERPIFGWGADTFRLLFPMFKPAEYVEVAGYLSVADNVHNYPLQLASGIGIPGALLLYGLIAYALVTSASDVFAKGKGAERLLLAGFWAAVAGYVVHLLFGLSVTGSTVVMWLAMGVLLSPGAHTRLVGTPSWKAVALPVVAVLVIAGTVFNVRFIVADHHYLTGRVLKRGTEAVAAIERAIELNPYNEMYRLERGSAWQQLFQASAEQYASTGDEAQRNAALSYLANAEAAYRDMIQYVYYEYDTYVFFANLYNQAALYLDPAYYPKAVEIARLGVIVEEHGPAARVQLAVGLIGLGQIEEAAAELEVATALDSRYVQAWLILGDTYRRLGRADDALAAFEHVLKRAPDNVEALNSIAAIEAEESSAATSAQ